MRRGRENERKIKEKQFLYVLNMSEKKLLTKWLNEFCNF